jgi:hypothetical protein
MHTTLLDAELLLMQLVQEQAEQQPADETEAARRWYAEHAPPAVLDYIWAIDAEIQADGLVYVDEVAPWLDEHHPGCMGAVIDGLERVGSQDLDMPARLRYVQGWLVRWAEWRLGWAYARDRQPLTGGVWYDRIVEEMVAHDLLGWSYAEELAIWNDPALFADQWHVAGTTDLVTLERAGLFRPELELLAATE